jgi:hypothetical protein
LSANSTATRSFSTAPTAPPSPLPLTAVGATGAAPALDALTHTRIRRDSAPRGVSSSIRQVSPLGTLAS